MGLQRGGGKLPGKEKYSGRRRSMTRISGFSSHEDSTGGEFQREHIKGVVLKKGQRIKLSFSIPKHAEDQFIGFGFWFWLDGEVNFEAENIPKTRTLKQFNPPSWGKCGSMWQSINGDEWKGYMLLEAKRFTKLAFFNPSCGVIGHNHIDNVVDNETEKRKKALLGNMYTYSPEAHFYATLGKTRFSPALKSLEPMRKPVELCLKSCNRCARFLPINVFGAKERDHLSFSNQCVASHRRPCRHGGFGVLKDIKTGEKIELEYGFQLECRFCKKFEVNAAHNPQRSPDQMKEDAARRRGFELLMEKMLGGSPQLVYRHQTGSELATDIWNKFDRKCFKCNATLANAKSMHLDHTRPLALLWPLDETATALCKACNTEKRDRPPALFYDAKELTALSKVTNLTEDELRDPHPNEQVLSKLAGNLEWFFDEFLTASEMAKKRDGKVTGEVLVKALHKVDVRRPGGARLNLLAEYEARRKR